MGGLAAAVEVKEDGGRMGKPPCRAMGNDAERERRRGEERRQRRGSGETRWRGVKGRKRGAVGRVDQREQRQKKR